MKILKKIGLIAIVFVVCIVSSIPKINAYDFYHFNASSTEPGTVLYRPLLNANLNRVSLQGSTTYYSYPLTQQFYHSNNSSSSIYNSIYDSNLLLRYRLGSIANGLHHLTRVNENVNDPNSTDYVDVLDYAYKSALVEYLDTSTNDIERFELTIEHNFFQCSDIYWSLDLYTNDISGSIDVKYIVEGYEDNVFKSQTYTINVPLTTATNSTYYSIDYDPFDNINDFNLYGFGYITPTRYSVQITPATDFVGDFSSINHYVFYTQYVDILNHSLITQFMLTHFNISNVSNVPNPPIDNDIDFTSWLVNSVGSFMNFEIFPGFRLSTMLGVVVAVPLLIYILKFFMGG